MKKLLPFFLLLSLNSFSQVYGWRLHTDTLFLIRSVSDTIQITRIPYAWGTTTGTLSNQTDLQTALNSKVNISDTSTMLGNYARTAAMTALFAGKQASGSYAVTTNNLSDLSNATTARSNLGLVIGTNVLAPNGSAANLTSFPTLNQNTSGTAAGLSANIAESQVTNLTTDLAAKAPLASPAFTGTPTGIIGGWDNVLKVSGSDVTTTGQTLVDITGLVTPTLTVSTLYEIEVILIVSTSAVATGTEYGINCTGTGTAQGILYMGPTTVTASVQVLNETGTNGNNVAATPAFLTTASEIGVIKIWGYVSTGTGSPTIAIRHLKVTSGTSTVKIGSSFKYRKL